MIRVMHTVNGLHHVTAIAGPAQENLDFYAGVLGMRLVKRSVNQDDPGTRDGAWKWFAAHRDAALARVPAMFQSFYAGVGNAFCSTEGRQSFNTVLGERLRSASGGEVQVDRALEGINDCVALRAADFFGLPVLPDRALAKEPVRGEPGTREQQGSPP